MRWIWWITSASAATFAAAILGLWIACLWWSFSYVSADAKGWLRWAVFCEDGHIYVVWDQAGAPGVALSPQPLVEPNPQGTWWRRPPQLGPASLAVTPPGTRVVLPGATGLPGGLNWITFPLAYPLAASLLGLAVLSVAPVRRWRRRRSGRCTACGYDLRRSPGACPECGWTP